MRPGQRQLFPQRIMRVLRVCDRLPVPVPNGSDAVYAVDDEGNRWVKKPLVGANDLVAESIGWLLSDALGIPTPRGAVCGTGNETVWLSEFLYPTVHWDPSRAQSLKNPDDLGAILTLDAIIGNWDRHDGNLLLRPEDGPEQLKVYSIDLAGAWIGTPDDIARSGLEVPDVHKLVAGIPVDMIREGAEKCAELAAGMVPATLDEYVREACAIAQERRVQMISDALCHRCQQAPRLVQDYLRKIEGRL